MCIVVWATSHPKFKVKFYSPSSLNPLMESATLMVSKHSNHIITYLTGKSGSEIPDMLPVEKDLSISIAF